MSRYEFRTIVKAMVTYNGQILIGQKEEDEDHPIGGEWHIPGGHLEKDEKVEEAVKREVEEETGLDVSIHRIIDVMTFPWRPGEEKNSVQVFYHCEANSGEAEPLDDLQDVKWVQPEEIEEEVGQLDYEVFSDRENLNNFLEKLEKMPAF